MACSENVLGLFVHYFLIKKEFYLFTRNVPANCQKYFLRNVFEMLSSISISSCLIDDFLKNADKMEKNPK
jgi:hypothetical protein